MCNGMVTVGASPAWGVGNSLILATHGDSLANAGAEMSVTGYIGCWVA
jgi:hypothetical protein